MSEEVPECKNGNKKCEQCPAKKTCSGHEQYNIQKFWSVDHVV